MPYAWYFAYGSNMQTATFHGRRGVKFHRAVPGRAPGWELVLDKPPLVPIGESFANIVPNPDAAALGVLYEIDETALKNIGITEGVFVDNYRWVEIEVQPLSVSSTTPVKAQTLTSNARDDTFQPSHRYMGLLIQGALEHGLPDDYIAFLRNIPSRPESPEAAEWRPLVDEALKLLR